MSAHFLSPRSTDLGGTQTHQVQSFTRAWRLTLSQGANSRPEAVHSHSPQHLHLFWICMYWGLINVFVMCEFRVALRKPLHKTEATVNILFLTPQQLCSMSLKTASLKTTAGAPIV